MPTGPALVWNPSAQAADFVLGAVGWDQGNALSTAIILSCFCDARDNTVTDDPRGWFGDAFPNVDGDVIGSLVWKEYRTKDLATEPDLLRQRFETALRWLITDGVCSSIPVTVTRVGLGQYVVAISPVQPDPSKPSQQFKFVWSQP